jgi:hypothetical protein
MTDGDRRTSVQLNKTKATNKQGNRKDGETNKQAREEKKAE